MPLNATTEPICFSENRAVFINLKDEVEFFIKVMNFHQCLVAIQNRLLYAEMFRLLLLGLWFAYTFVLLKNIHFKYSKPFNDRMISESTEYDISYPSGEFLGFR